MLEVEFHTAEIFTPLVALYIYIYLEGQNADKSGIFHLDSCNRKNSYDGLPTDEECNYSGVVLHVQEKWGIHKSLASSL